MDLEEIKQVLRRLNQKSWKLPEILYWMCDSRALTDEQIGDRVSYSHQTIYSRKLTLNEIFQSHGIDSTDAIVCQAIRELAGNPPRFHPWPPLEEVSVIQGNESGNEADLSTIEGEENQNFPPEDFEEEAIEEETEEPRVPPPPIIGIPGSGNRQRHRSPSRWPFFLVVGLLILAFVFGFILITQGWRPFNRGTATPQSQEVAENETSTVSQPTPDLEATREQIREDIVASRTPTAAFSPIPNETQLFIEESNLFVTQGAQTLEAISATETALVTDTPSPMPTQTSTPTPSWTPSPTLTPSPVPPPPTDNLVLHLPLDGNTNDASGNGLNVQSNSALPTEGRYGEPNTAYFFNGESAIVIPDALELRGNTYPLTVAVWINPVRTSGVNPVIVKYLNASRKDWGLRIDDDLLTFTSENGTGTNNRADYICRQNSGTVLQDTWQMVVFVADEPNIYLYLNGELVASCSEFVDRWTDTEQPVELGMIGYQGIGYVGAIDEVQIWNQALSAEEILNLYLFTK